MCSFNNCTVFDLKVFLTAVTIYINDIKGKITFK